MTRQLLSLVSALLLTWPTFASAQSNDQAIIDSLIAGEKTSAQLYMDQLSRVDASRLQCRLLVNFNYIFDYKNEFYTQENIDWVLENLAEKGYGWPADCSYRNRVQESHCLIFGVEMGAFQADLIRQAFDALSNCRPDNTTCANLNNNYSNAVYTDTYLTVVDDYFSNRINANRSRQSCDDFNSWSEAIVRTHTDYFRIGWAVYSDFQLASGARSLQKSLDGMQQYVDIDRDILKELYDFQLDEFASTDSIGARAKHQMFVETLRPYIEE